MSSLKILFVEDNADLTMLSSLFLKTAGHSVTIAHSGQQALAALNELNPDMIFLDLTLPDTNPEHLVQSIRKMECCSEIPLVLASGKDELESWGDRLGAQQVLKKPYSRTQLLDIVNSYINTSRSDD